MKIISLTCIIFVFLAGCAPKEQIQTAPAQPPAAEPVPISQPPAETPVTQNVTPSPTTPSPPHDCSACLPPGATDCTAACVGLNQEYTAGTCVTPGSTDPNNCCTCTKPESSAPKPSPATTQSLTGCTGTCRNNQDCPAQTAQKYINGNVSGACTNVYRLIEKQIKICTHHAPITTTPGISCQQTGGVPDLACVCP